MKVLHTADWHLDKGANSYKNPRTDMSYAFDSNKAVMKEIIDTAIDESVDLLVVSGDLTDHGRPAPEVIASIGEELARAQDAGIAVDILKGNHESLHVSPLQRTVTNVLGQTLNQGVDRASQAGSEVRLTDFGFAQVLSIPYPSRSTILSILKAQGVKVKSEEEDAHIVRHVIESVERIINSSERDESLPLIISGHFTASMGQGALLKMGSEREMASQQLDIPLPIAPLMDYDPSYIALGHIHTPQKLAERVYYSGSPNALTFGDAGDTKGYNIVTIDKNALDVRVIPTRNARVMEVVDLEHGEVFNPDAMVEHGAYLIRLPAGEIAVPKPIADKARELRAYIRADRKPIRKKRIQREVIEETVSESEALGQWLSKIDAPAERKESALKRYATAIS